VLNSVLVHYNEERMELQLRHWTAQYSLTAVVMRPISGESGSEVLASYSENTATHFVVFDDHRTSHRLFANMLQQLLHGPSGADSDLE
jgi:hypothetical protein